MTLRKFGFIQEFCQQSYQQCFQFMQSDPMKSSQHIDSDDNTNEPSNSTPVQHNEEL